MLNHFTIEQLNQAKNTCLDSEIGLQQLILKHKKILKSLDENTYNYREKKVRLKNTINQYIKQLISIRNDINFIQSVLNHRKGAF